jgi:beta-lactamase class A
MLMNYPELEKRNKVLERRWKILLVIAIIFIASRPVALYIVNNLIHKAVDEAQCNTELLYVNKAAICEPAVIRKTDYASTQEKLTIYIEQEKSNNKITEAAVYFRDLKNGPAWGVNEGTDFAPASLLKVPIALVYFREAETNPNILKQRLSFPPHPAWERISQTYKPEQNILPDTSYEVEDLLERMVKYSDNDSYGLLQTYLDETGHSELIQKTFLELGILAPQDIYDQVVDVRRYASIFRGLYNSTIINSDYSEKILKWLVDAEFYDGLRSKIPNEIKVASKFGERLLPDGTKQLHDCGIVYYPDNPYLICIMTKGNDFASMAQVIAQISSDIYIEVDSRRID